MSSQPTRWMAYLAGWTLFALFFISEDAGRLLYQGKRPVARLPSGLADHGLRLGFSCPLRLVAGWPLSHRAPSPVAGLGVIAEGAPKIFQPGNVLCYEPTLTSGNQAFFVEDTFLIVPTGHETLNPVLPYSGGDIEQAMAIRRSP
jgi:hypothetical protein